MDHQSVITMSKAHQCDVCGEYMQEPFYIVEGVRDHGEHGIENRDLDLCEECTERGASVFHTVIRKPDKAAHIFPWEQRFSGRPGEEMSASKLADWIAKSEGFDTWLGDDIVEAAIEAGRLEGEYDKIERDGTVTLPSE